MAKFKHKIGKILFEANTNITLWQAIKLRIAGRNYKLITDEIIKQIKTKFQEAYK
jgi:hypothetical protein